MIPNSPAVDAQGGAFPHEYKLSDDLARLCLPQEFKDSNRNLAWANSICALFLLIGLVGLKPTEVRVRQITPPPEAIPLEIIEQQPEVVKIQPDQAMDEPETTREIFVDQPQVITVVAASTPNVAFAVPVTAAQVAIASNPRVASPPPAVLNQAPRPTRFNPNAAGNEGYYPQPTYPGVALRNRYHGTVTIALEVDPSGQVVDAKVQKSSGYDVLDNAALEVVQKRWRFPAGERRLFLWDCVFQLR